MRETQEVRKHLRLFERNRLYSTGIITAQITRRNVAVYGRRDSPQVEAPPAIRLSRPSLLSFNLSFCGGLNHKSHLEMT